VWHPLASLADLDWVAADLPIVRQLSAEAQK